MLLDLVESGLGREFNIAGKEECIFQVDWFISGRFGPAEICGTLDSFPGHCIGQPGDYHDCFSMQTHHQLPDTQRNSLQGPCTSKWVKHLQGSSSHTTARGMAVHVHAPSVPLLPVASHLKVFGLKSCRQEWFRQTHTLLEGSYGGGESQLPFHNIQPWKRRQTIKSTTSHQDESSEDTQLPLLSKAPLTTLKKALYHRHLSQKTLEIRAAGHLWNTHGFSTTSLPLKSNFPKSLWQTSMFVQMCFH